jgi:hypothetical protein
MRKPILLLAGASLLAVSFGASAAERCQYSAPRNAAIEAAGLQSVTVQIGPDVLAIHGVPGLEKIVVRGTACASNAKWLRDVQVETARQGDAASVIARDRRHGIAFSLFGGSYAYLKLDVSVPPSLAVKLREGSGDASVMQVAALEATLGSGDLKVDGISGAFGLGVGSGDAVARDVGSLAISALGSGDVSVDTVHADAHIGSVGSGNLKLDNVKGDVSLGALASGDVKMSGVGGNVKADSVGSGDLIVRDVTGDVSVGAVASGSVSIARAGGNVHAGSVGSGDFDANGVGGTFSVDALGSGGASHRNVKGKVSVPRED